jgi:hypothetical protein
VPGYEASAWDGICASKNTPTEIVERLNKEVNAGLTLRDVFLMCSMVATSPCIV